MIATIQLQIIPGPSLPGRTLSQLADKAAKAGQTVDEFLSELIRREVEKPPRVVGSTGKPAPAGRKGARRGAVADACPPGKPPPSANSP